jgi:serine/threonine-protein kinase
MRRPSGSSATDPLELYDELVMDGHAPEPAAFAARYPDHPDLLVRIAGLEALRADIDRELGHATQHEPRPPAQVGGFRLGKRLGVGGMGAVYEGLDPSTGGRYAIKLLRYQTAAALVRFEREARLASSLDHPAIAHVFAFGREGALAWLATELVAGRSLRDRLSDCPGGLPLEEALRIGLAVAEALAHAHAAGVLHRDVKPSNVMLGAEGRVRLIDFGLAIEHRRVNDRITRTGAFVGSHNYAAPEQLRGARPDLGPPTDVYAAGATLYETLVGRTPFESPTIAARLRHVDEKPPRSPRRLRPEVPRGVEKVVLRALAPAPKRRFATGGELAAAVRALLG